MQDYAFIPKYREILTVQIRKNTITGALILSVLMLVLLPFVIYTSLKSDYVTYSIICYIAVAALGALVISWYRHAKLYWTQIDTRDLSRIINSDNPIRQELTADTKKLSDYTYGELLNVLASYERLVAAAEYDQTGDNKKFRVMSSETPKWLKMSLRPLRYFSLKLVLLSIILAQIAVGWGVLPTVQELVTGHPLPSLSLHMSAREILENIVAPRAITIGLLHGIRVLLRSP